MTNRIFQRSFELSFKWPKEGVCVNGYFVWSPTDNF